MAVNFLCFFIVDMMNERIKINLIFNSQIKIKKDKRLIYHNQEKKCSFAITGKLFILIVAG